jgi:hypothetical protein
MPSRLMDIILPTIPPMLYVIIGAIITYMLNVRRSTHEKLWELRRVAYGSILAEMKYVEYVLDSADEYIKKDEMRYFAGQAFIHHNAAIGKHMLTVRKNYMDNYLILSEKFISEFDLLLNYLDSTYPDFDPQEEHTHFASAIRAAQPKLLRQARSEMPVKLSIWQRVLSMWQRVCH